MKGVRLTDKKRAHILEVYVRDGYRAAKPLAIEYNIRPEYIAQIARESGFYRRASITDRAAEALRCFMQENLIGRVDLCQSRFPEHVKVRARAINSLKQSGFGHRAIATVMGLNPSTVRYWLSPTDRRVRTIKSQVRKERLSESRAA